MQQGAGSSSMEVDQVLMNKKRDDEIGKLLKILDIIVDTAGGAVKTKITDDYKSDIVDIDFSNELSGILMTVYTGLRKKANSNTNVNTITAYSAYKATVNNVEISIGTIITKVEESDIKLDFLTATPIVELMTLFRNSFDEVRNGVTKFQVKSGTKNATKKVVGSTNKTICEQTLSNYGLNNNHIPLMQGITFPPERRTGLIRSLGPMAKAILLIQEDKYFDKLESALKNSLLMLPMAEEIARCFREARNPGSVQGVLCELGDLLLLTTARSTQKIYLPLLLVKVMWDVYQSYRTVNWSFSGTGILVLYSEAATKIKFTMKTSAVDDLIKQVVFHACFGTYLDDLGILSKITDRTAAWNKRKELNSCFTERSKQSVTVFSPVRFRLVSKMAQALQTKSLGNVNPVCIGRPSFTGFRKRTLTGGFVNYMTSGKISVNFSSDPLQLQYALKKIKDEIFSNRDDKKILMSGTNNWLIKDNKGFWVETDEVPEESGSYFFGA